jgi:hypothetical protein
MERATMRDADYQRIEAEISSDSSPVGIDAKKTHVLILGKLESIERRLDALEQSATPALGEHLLELASVAPRALAAITDVLKPEVKAIGASVASLKPGDTDSNASVAFVMEFAHQIGAAMRGDENEGDIKKSVEGTER